MDTAHATHKARTTVNKHPRAMDTTHTAHQARLAVNKPQVAMDTAHTAHQARTPVSKRQMAMDTAHTSAPSMADVQVTTNHTHRSDTMGRPSRSAGPAAGAVPQALWSEPGQATPGTMANVTRSHGSNR